jgi:hypothetical protein
VIDSPPRWSVAAGSIRGPVSGVEPRNVCCKSRHPGFCAVQWRANCTRRVLVKSARGLPRPGTSAHSEDPTTLRCEAAGGLHARCGPVSPPLQTPVPWTPILCPYKTRGDGPLLPISKVSELSTAHLCLDSQRLLYRSNHRHSTSQKHLPVLPVQHRHGNRCRAILGARCRPLGVHLADVGKRLR